MKKGLLILGTLVLTLMALLLGGCSGNSAQGTMQVYVTDAPPKGVTAVNIKASTVEAHQEGEDEGTWVTVLNDPPVFDLVKATGVNVLLGTGDIAAGKYTQIRMTITEVTVTIGGQDVKATVPSDKLKLVGNITIEEGKATPISLDFDAEKSIVLKGQGDVALQPVVKLIVGEPDAALATPTPTATDTTTTETETPTTTPESTPSGS